MAQEMRDDVLEQIQVRFLNENQIIYKASFHLVFILVSILHMDKTMLEKIVTFK